ncbi:hypothetical protein [Arenimonas sp. MALMAid1274]|uniref:hypothetical protein n=1 Tax=Arenimonas sp. MALMAid1274 TaxID=3411630 RepID=UPI003BA35CC2
MTVLMREELNDADLAWAAADPSVAAVMGQVVRARLALGAMTGADMSPGRREPIDPEVLRARGAL